MFEGNRWSDRWINRRGEEREKTNVSASGCGWVCDVHVAWLAKETDTRCPREREETNCLHYANAVQLQLTVAKNRCRYRGMLSRTSREFLSSPRPVFLGPLTVIPLFHSLYIRSTLRLFLDSKDPLAWLSLSLSLEWNGSEGEDRIGTFPIPTLHFTLKNFCPFPLTATVVVNLSLFVSFLCKKPRSLASPLPKNTMAPRGKVFFSKKTNDWLRNDACFSGTLSKR